MAAFQFPDPTVQQTVLNPITGSTYQWKEPPGKWVVTVSMRDVSDIIWEGDLPPNPVGDYKLWYSTDTLELYFYYCDANGVCAWLPTSVPITAIEELTAFAAQAELDIDQLQYKQQILQNAVDQIYLQSQTGAGNRPPIFSDTEPDKHPDYTPPQDELIAGDIWYDNTDPDNLEQYIYDGTQWVVFGGQFVHRQGGDTMEGQLVIDGPRKAGDDPDNPGLVSSVKVLSIDNAQNSSLQLRHSGNAKIYIGDTDVAIASDIKFVRAAGSIVKTDDADLINIKGEEVSYTGKTENDTNLVTKKYVDDADEELRQGIITIDEELESIAPSTERGQWMYEKAADPFRSPNSGKYFLIKGITAASDIGLAQFTEDYTEATGAVFSSTDNDGTSHTWSDVEADELIDLLDKPDPDGLFGTITEINTSTHSTGAAIIMWDRITAIGSPTNNEPYLTNVKIFSPPTGGTASEFVKKSGDTMTGNLVIDKSTGTADVAGALTLKGERPDDTNSAATIKFENANNSANPGYLTYKSYGTSNTFSFDRDVELNNKSFTGVGNISMIAGGNIRYSTNDRIRVNSSGGSLRYGGSAQLFWGTDGVSIEKARADNVSGSGFIVKGKIHSSSYTNSGYTDADGDLLEVFHNASGQDAINYNGKIANSRNIATKEYVDSKLPTYKITKSNGNYYVQ